jgi:predicted methyltransferase
MKRFLLTLAVAALTWSAGYPYQAAPKAAPKAAAAKPGTHPVTGRQIAGVMGMGGANWLVRPEREEEEHPEQALDEMRIRPGMKIADIGAGVGYMSLRMAKRVGPTGRIYAVDIQPGMLELLRQRAAAENITNVEPILGETADPKLPPGQMDIVLMVDVYHELAQPQLMLRKIHEALKPDGRLILLEYRAEDPNVAIIAEHKMTVDQVRREIEAEGFQMQPPVETLPVQHLLILTKR